MNLSTAKVLLLTSMTITTALLAGCTDAFTARDLQATALSSNKASVQVDIIGLNEEDAGKVNAFTPLDWFGNTNKEAVALRNNLKGRGLIKAAKLGPNSNVLIGKNDPLWAAWTAEKATKIAVIAQPISSTVGEKNSFMRIVPSMGKSFDGDTIEVKINDQSGLQIVPAPK